VVMRPHVCCLELVWGLYTCMWEHGALSKHDHQP